ncbi:MAG: sigma-70 family RNA polymerase sigma factor [Prochlorococcaceae cyanobacterium]
MACSTPHPRPSRPSRPSRSSSSSRSSGFTPACDRLRRNSALLAAYARSRDPQLRQELIELNWPLVRQVALRLAPRTDLELDDLIQIGGLGLIRAVDAFDPARRVALSSFAVPYVRGAILHYLRDQHGCLRPPRRLRELQQQAEKLQLQRRHRGLAPLPQPGLAAALGVEQALLREAIELPFNLRLQRLDAPAGPGQDGASLLDLLAAPAGLAKAGLPEAGQAAPGLDPRLQWLRSQVAELDPLLQRLLEGRWLEQRPWAELAAELGIHPRMAQRRLQTLIHELRLEGQRCFATP